MPSSRPQCKLRTSTRWPAIAAAAAISGLTRWVRPPLPWRPSKLRLLVEGQRSPGGAAAAGGAGVGVEARPHRAARPPPVEAGVAEDLVEPLGLGLPLHLHRARH